MNEPSSWIGFEIEIATTEPGDVGIWTLEDADPGLVDILIGEQSAGVFPWRVGYVAYAHTGPIPPWIVIVSDEPNPYRLIDEKRIAEPDPEMVHDLMVWAVNPVTATTSLITDAMAIQLPATALEPNRMKVVSQDPWWCQIDATVDSEFIVAFFDLQEPPTESQYYPAHLVLTIDAGKLSSVPPEKFRCILNQPL